MMLSVACDWGTYGDSDLDLGRASGREAHMKADRGGAKEGARVRATGQHIFSSFGKGGKKSGGAG